MLRGEHSWLLCSSGPSQALRAASHCPTLWQSQCSLEHWIRHLPDLHLPSIPLSRPPVGAVQQIPLPVQWARHHPRAAGQGHVPGDHGGHEDYGHPRRGTNGYRTGPPVAEGGEAGGCSSHTLGGVGRPGESFPLARSLRKSCRGREEGLEIVGKWYLRLEY